MRKLKDINKNFTFTFQTDVEKVKVTEDTVHEVTIQIAIEMPFDIRTITSPSHKVKVKKTASKAVVELPKNSTLHHGFQLQIGLAEIHVPRMWVEEDGDSRACMLTFYPEFEVNEVAKSEIVFLLDCSNSMKGEAISAAKKVLMLALNVLPEKAHFNVVGFGSTHRELFGQSVKMSEKSLAKAADFIQELHPNMGNTDAWRPLQVFNMLTPSEDQRNIFLISDGHLSCDKDTLRMVRESGPKNRIFTLGISSTVNAHLLKSLATNGCGAYEFFDTSTKSKWEQKLLSLIEKCHQPGLSGVMVDWQTYGEDSSSTKQAPRELMSLFSGSRQVVYGFVQNCTQVVRYTLIDLLFQVDEVNNLFQDYCQ